MQMKSLKRQDKEERKADRAGLQEWRHSQAAAHAAATSQSLLRRAAQTEKVPIRAKSDPTNKTAKDAAAHFVRKLTSSRSVARLTRRSRTAPIPVPHIDDFDSKAELREHLHASNSPPESNVAELPGSLPPYTPFEDSTANATNAPFAAVEDPATTSPVLRSNSTAKDGHCEYEVPKMMRCDHCQFGIRVEEPYFQCSVCNSGDRILCSACDAAGNSCRHELTERVRRVLRYDNGSRQTSDQVPSSDDLARKRSPRRNHNTNDNAALPGSRSSAQDLDERKYSSQLRDLELRRREQDLSLRDREATLRERELLQRQERQSETEASKAAYSQERTLQLQSDLMRQYSEMASMLGTQFTDLKAELSASRSASVRSSTPTDNSSEGEAIDPSKVDDGVRQHAGKRKAGNAPSRSGSAKSPKRPGISPRGSLPNEVDSEDDCGEDSDSQENKSTGKEMTNPEKLFACHYCKFEGARYSERNNLEKAYRGCSSGYWPDISRLKQHLYRVHWRGKHCKRCFTPFKTDAELDRHSQQLEPCQRGEITFQEKFDDAKYHEVRRKRPGKTYEEVWYIIYEILFPAAPRPSSPYADGADGQAVVEGDPANVQPTWEALGQAFGARLDRHQAQDQQAWLRLPGARTFLMEQLRACMVEVQQTTPVSSPAPPPSSRRPHQPVLRLSTQQTPGSSIATSPLPTSATSTRSTSSGRCLLPSHSRSFSRPLIRPWQHEDAQAQQSYPRPQQESTRHTMSGVPDNSMDGVTFAVPYEIDPENDQYDDECHSWQEGDEMGLAITTDNFDFDFRQASSATGSGQMSVTQEQHMRATQSELPLLNSQSLGFKPVKVSSLEDPVPGQAVVESTTDLKLNISNASADSGYNSGSMSSRAITSDQPRHKYCKTTAAHVNKEDAPVPDDELNYDALNVPFQDFLNGESGEYGDVGSSEFNEYWTATYELETT